MIPQAFINGLLERVDAVDVIGKRVQLRKVGNHHTGLCPFHEEKTPSFHVYADHYHCFGCGAHGTTASFLMEREGLDFPEAIEALAATVGLEVPRERGAKPQADPGLYEVLAAADRCFRGWLRQHEEGPAAIAYLQGRGLSGEVVRDFGIGLAPSGWESLKTALKPHGEDKLLAAGLLAENASGKTYDRFRGRIVFPIRNVRGRVIGFGGRIYDGSGANGEGPREGEPKYLNSPETDVFKKGRELYGLFEARRANQRFASAVLVEGYMDVVALAGRGITNAVAALGTAVGEAHFNSLYKHVTRVVCCFDGDEAGTRAAGKATSAAFPALSEQRELRFVFLPQGEDPDSVVHSRGRAHFETLLDAAKPVGTYFLESQQAGLDLNTADGRALLVDLALPHLGQLPPGTLRTVLIGDLARLSQTPADKLEARLGNTETVTAPQPQPPPHRSRIGDRVLEHLVKQPQLFHHLAPDCQERLIIAAGHSLLGEVATYLQADASADAATLHGRFVGDQAHAELVGLAERPTLLATPEGLRDEFADAVARFLAECERQARLALLDDTRQSGSLHDLRRYWDRRA